MTSNMDLIAWKIIGMSTQRVVEFVSDNELSIIVFLVRYSCSCIALNAMQVLGWTLCFTGIVDVEAAKLSISHHRGQERILSQKGERYTSASVVYSLLGLCLAGFCAFTFYNKILRRSKSLSLIKVKKYSLDLP